MAAWKYPCSLLFSIYLSVYKCVSVHDKELEIVSDVFHQIKVFPIEYQIGQTFFRTKNSNQLELVLFKLYCIVFGIK